MGFLHYNTDINKICTRSWQAPSFFSNSPALSCITGVQNCHGGKPDSDKVVKKINTQLLNGQLSLLLQPRDSAYFTPWSFIFTLNTEDDSVHNCFLVPHPLSIRHSHLKGRLCQTQQPSPVTLYLVTEMTQCTVSIHPHRFWKQWVSSHQVGLEAALPDHFEVPLPFSQVLFFSQGQMSTLSLLSVWVGSTPEAHIVFYSPGNVPDT